MKSSLYQLMSNVLLFKSRKLMLALLLLCGLAETKAQQDIMISQYMFNGLFVNPGYAGSHKYYSASLIHRRQWEGFSGAPKTSIVSLDGPIKDRHMGIGGIIAHDKIGVTKQTDLLATYSYYIKLGPGKLSFGAKGGVSNYTSTVADLTVWDQDDKVFANNKKSAWLPKFGAGAYYYTQKLYAGIAIPTLLAYDSKNNFNLDVTKSSFVRRHYFINAGYVFAVNDQVKIKPSVLLKYQKAAPLEGDINVNVFLNDIFCIGASYRTGDAILAIVEYQINNRFRVGYSFDYTTSKLSKFNSGSHEIMLSYDFGEDIIKMKTPRYF